MGRPKVKIDWEQVADWCRAHCNGVAIASFLGIDPETFYNRCKMDNNIGFHDFSAAKKSEGVMLVEASIYNDALTKGGTDRIFWLKNKADWRDKSETDHNIKNIDVIELNYIVPGEAASEHKTNG